jgi:hypothetical protein
MSHKIQEGGNKEIQAYLAKDNCELMMSEHCEGRIFLLGIKKGLTGKVYR